MFNLKAYATEKFEEFEGLQELTTDEAADVGGGPLFAMPFAFSLTLSLIKAGMATHELVEEVQN